MKVRRPLLVRNRHQLGLALLMSACAHLVLVVAAGLNSPPESGGLMVSQRKGTLTVVSIGVAGKAVNAPASPRQAAPLPDTAAQTLKAVKPARAPSVPPHGTATQQMASPAPPGPDPAPVAGPNSPLEPVRPGARFASLFAPILSQPLGHGRWRSAPPAPEPPQDPQLLRQQALLGLTQALRQRLDGLGTLACRMRLDTDSHEAAVDCDGAEETAQVWAVLQGLLRPGDPAPSGMAAMCLDLSQGRTLVQTCASPLPDRTVP